MRGLKKLVMLVVVVAAAAFIFMYSGVYDIAATTPHWGPVRHLISLTVDHSVERHARGIQVPNLQDSALIRLGFGHYNEMCVTCHGAPGVKPEEFARGLYPHAPRLWGGHGGGGEEAETFWIIKHGIKMTGMPAFQPTHTDHEIWAITAFMDQFSHIDSAAYARMRQQWGGDNDEDHGGKSKMPETPVHS